MEVNTDSIPTLFSKLSNLFLDTSDPKVMIIQPLVSKYDRQRKLKRNIYNTLFHHLKGPHRYLLILNYQSVNVH